MAEQTAIHPKPLRCYVRRSGRSDRWIAHCIDWDVWAVGSSAAKAKASLEDALRGYARVVMKSDDLASIERLLARRAPLRYVLLWHVIRGISQTTNHRGPLGSEPFMQKLAQFSPC